jgi:hypothetical protein
MGGRQAPMGKERKRARSDGEQRIINVREAAEYLPVGDCSWSDMMIPLAEPHVDTGSSFSRIIHKWISSDRAARSCHSGTDGRLHVSISSPYVDRWSSSRRIARRSGQSNISRASGLRIAKYVSHMGQICSRCKRTIDPNCAMEPMRTRHVRRQPSTSSSSSASTATLICLF